VLALAESMLRAEIAAAQRSWPDAVRYAQAAVRREQTLEVDEPPVWPLPSLQLLGRLQVQAGAPRAALASYRRDLELHPANAYALAGSAAAQRALGDSDLADRSMAEARTAWAHADRPLPVL
jgi:hypothetical protein